MLLAFQVQMSLPLSFGRTVGGTNSNWGVSEAIRRGESEESKGESSGSVVLELLMLPTWQVQMSLPLSFGRTVGAIDLN